MAKRLEDLAPEARAKVEALRARHRTPEARAEEAAVRERFRDRPGPADLLARGEIDHDDCERMMMSLKDGPPPGSPGAAIRELREAREHLGLTLAELAERSGIDQPALSRLERGQVSNPTYETLNRYAAALGRRVRWVVEPVGGQPRPAETSA